MSQKKRDPDLTRIFSENLLAWITKRGVTANYLAKEAGVSPVFMGKLLHGQSLPSLLVFKMICEKLKIKPEKLIYDPNE